MLGGLVLITVGMGVFTQVERGHRRTRCCSGRCSCMGMGMGMTMMPIMSAALATLPNHEVARGSTLMNIVQQTAGSIGTAVMSVILTNQVLGSPAASAYTAVTQGMVPPDQVPAEVFAQGQSSLADAFGGTYAVALVLIALCIVPSLFLPRKKIDHAVEPEQEEGLTVAAVMH